MSQELNAVNGGRPSSLIQEEAGMWAGLTTQNHLSEVFGYNAMEVRNMVTMDARAAESNAINQLLAAYSNKQINDREYEWNLMDTTFNSRGEKTGGLVWITDNSFDPITGEAFVDSALRKEVMNLKIKRDER
jgi:hypothetical protein